MNATKDGLTGWKGADGARKDVHYVISLLFNTTITNN